MKKSKDVPMKASFSRNSNEKNFHWSPNYQSTCLLMHCPINSSRFTESEQHICENCKFIFKGMNDKWIVVYGFSTTLSSIKFIFIWPIPIPQKSILQLHNEWSMEKRQLEKNIHFLNALLRSKMTGIGFNSFLVLQQQLKGKEMFSHCEAQNSFRQW